MQKFTELKVWQRSHQLALEVYRMTTSFPSEERFGVISQIRRAAVSVPTNIAEGSKKKSSREYARFLNIAEGSLAETEYLLLLCRDLGYLDSDLAVAKIQEADELSRMLFALRGRVEKEV